MNYITHLSSSFIFFFSAQLGCSSTSCGSVAWLRNNPNYMRYFVNGKCADQTPLTSLTAATCFCPSLQTLITPCTCAASPNNPGTVDIVCAGNAMPDDKMTSIISDIPATLPIGKLDLSSTGRTDVTLGLTKLTTIAELDLAVNQIAAVNNGALAVNSSTLMKLYLSFNQLATIEQTSLPSKSTYNQCKHLKVFYSSHFILLLIPHLSCLFVSCFWRVQGQQQ